MKYKIDYIESMSNRSIKKWNCTATSIEAAMVKAQNKFFNDKVLRNFKVTVLVKEA